MMDNFLTTNTFRKGLTNYLKNLAYKAATQDDLWRYLTDQAHKDGTLSLDMDVKTVMDTWTLQMGFPLVTIRRNYQDNTAIVFQERFLVGEKVRKLYTFCSFLTNMCFQETWSIGFEMVGAVDIH